MSSSYKYKRSRRDSSDDRTRTKRKSSSDSESDRSEDEYRSRKGKHRCRRKEAMKNKMHKRSPERRHRSNSGDRAEHKWGKDDSTDSKKHRENKWGKADNVDSKKGGDSTSKQKPNFALSGKLTEETNTYRGVVIKYSEPPEARKPKRRWRLYPFKGEKALPTLYIHRESGYLIGRDRKVVDMPVDHPSCSKQHAALQYRLVAFTRKDGSQGKRIRPYIIDLDSANGTYINNKKVEPKKYVELFEKDVIKFGYSSREYVLLHENSKDEDQDDDVKDEVRVKEEA